jgi:hypothetical protein
MAKKSIKGLGPSIHEMPRVSARMLRKRGTGPGGPAELPAVGTVAAKSFGVLLNEINLMRARMQNVESHMLNITLGHFGPGNPAELPAELGLSGGTGSGIIFRPVRGELPPIERQLIQEIISLQAQIGALTKSIGTLTQGGA